MVVLMPKFAAALVARRRCLIVVPMPMPEAPRVYLIVVYKPFPAAPLVVRCMYMAVVPGPMPVAVASQKCSSTGRCHQSHHAFVNENLLALGIPCSLRV